jgi:glycerol-3-phosphate dehydrogenase (NAD(P)+)
MVNIVILGAGVMGSALSVPAADAGNSVAVIGSPLDDAIVHSVNATRHHPTLNVDMPDDIRFVSNAEADASILRSADVIVIGVSSPGVGWATDRILQAQAKPSIISLVTKGLVARDADHAPFTYADTLDTVFSSLTKPPTGEDTAAARIVGIGGPCIARELALRIPTRVTFASQQIEAANEMRQLFATRYYRITTDDDVVAVEACAALKNFLCIGVSAMISAYQIDTGSAKNPVAGLYNQAVHELLTLSQWIASESPIQCTHQGVPVAFDLAGMGDLHVTVGGGRNSRLGHYLGQGERLSAVQNGVMKGVTVEGVDTGRNLSASCRAACQAGRLNPDAIPLTLAILDCIDNEADNEALFNFDFGCL